jgi:hypothetical protein
MNKEDALTIMMNSINADNREFCIQSGMSEAEADKNIEQSQMSLGLMMSNIYDKMVENGIIVAQ